jgi:hypothetical protein
MSMPLDLSARGHLEDARCAGELVSHALRRGRPTDKSDYRTLLDRYGTDPAFRDLTEAFATGLGLSVLATTRTGLVLAPDVESVFAAKLTDMRNTAMDSEERLIAGLALIGIAAHAYPNTVDLDDPDARIVDVVTIDAFIRASAAALPAVAAESAESLASARRAADLYLAWDAYVPTARGGGYKRGCTYRALDEVLAWMETQGMARPQPALGQHTYQLTDRFRVLVADEASNAAYEALTAYARTTDKEKVS